MAQGVDRAIAAISRRQHGHVTRGQLRELGVTEGELRYRLAVGRLTRVHYGVYALAGMTSSALGQAA
ncbi:MAG: type IV toxin-antitoxin system AbiEi family antitoxin domain-containing protein, partial [Solirubrobacterales bacterium]|nr:type IV toxin-antitoxin system AbiEi family antitoxin domain-containing protein [Solirubrobacterales bacterium]